MLHKLALIVMVLALCLSFVGQVAAEEPSADLLPQADLDALNGNWPHWVPGGGKCGSSGSVNVVGNDNAEKVFNYLVSKGLAPFQAAGVVGNMQAESGVQPLRLQGTPSGKETPSSQVNLSNKSLGWGLVQWTPASKMIVPTRDAGKNPDDLVVQLDFLWEQLTTGSEKGAGDALKATTTVEQAAEVFLVKYERPKNPAHSRAFRISASQQILAQYGNGAPSGISPSSGGCTATEGVPSGDAQALASQLIGQWGKNLVGNKVALQDLEAASKGQLIQNSDSCGNAVTLDLGLLQTLVTITTKYKVTVWNIVSGHGCDRYFHPKGAATDLGGITELSSGRSSNFNSGSSGNDPALNAQFVLFLASILPPDAGLGQSQCDGRAGVKSQMPKHIRFFADGCNHQHIQMRTSKK